MPRLFWKLFLALWVSIMAFAIVVSWINQTIILQNATEEHRPGQGFEFNLNRFEARLIRDLGEGGADQAKRTLRDLPRGMSNHIFVLDTEGNELLGRDGALRQLRKERIRVGRKQIGGTDGGTLYIDHQKSTANTCTAFTGTAWGRDAFACGGSD